MNPDFEGIYDVLVDAADKGIIKYIKVETNGVLPRPDVKPSKLVKWQGRAMVRRKHQPVLWSPEDLGVETQIGCQMLRRCGYSLDKFGYLPCSGAIMIARLFGLTHLYRQDIPDKPWGLEELCSKCVFSMDADWRKTYSDKNPTQHTEEEKSPTQSYKDALEKFDVEEFYRTQKEF